MSNKQSQSGVIPLAIIAVGFLVTSLVGVVISTNDEASNFALSSWAKVKPKTWRDIGNPKARQAAKSAAEADNAQAQAVNEVCPGGCTAEQLVNAGIEVVDGQNPSGFYYNEQSGSYYPIAASAGGGYGADALQAIGAAQGNAADSPDSTNDDTEQTDTAAQSNPQLQDPGHYGDEPDSAAQGGSGTGSQTGTIGTTVTSGTGSTNSYYQGGVDTGLGIIDFDAFSNNDTGLYSLTVDPLLGPDTNVDVVVDQGSIQYGVTGPLVDLGQSAAVSTVNAAAITPLAPLISIANAIDSTVDWTQNTLVPAITTANTVTNLAISVGMTVDTVIDNVSNFFAAFGN